MTINPKIWEFPSFPIKGQLFHVPGAMADGGLTSGGARIVSPEPGGFSMLQIEPALQTGEWSAPWASWLMSKVNGEILRVRLAPTPQIAYSANRDGAETVAWNNGVLWANQVEWNADAVVTFSAITLEGATGVTLDTTATGPIFGSGHVIGHGNYTYLIDEITYAGAVATIILRNPVRKAIAVNDPAYVRPWFLGRIMNPGDIMATYDAENWGAVQMGKIILGEAVVP